MPFFSFFHPKYHFSTSCWRRYCSIPPTLPSQLLPLWWHPLGSPPMPASQCHQWCQKEQIHRLRGWPGENFLFHPLLESSEELGSQGTATEEKHHCAGKGFTENIPVLTAGTSVNARTGTLWLWDLEIQLAWRDRVWVVTKYYKGNCHTSQNQSKM